MSGPRHHAPATTYPACPKCMLCPLCRPEAGGVADVEPFRRLLRRRRTIKRGAYLFRTGEPFHSVCAICSGSAKTCFLDDDGETRIAGFHFAGELIGIGALCDQQHQCDAIALEATEICEFPYGRLSQVAGESPLVGQVVFKLMREQVFQSQGMLTPFIGRRTAAERLAAYLLSLARRRHLRGLPALDFDLPMSRSDIGDYLGLAKETVSRLFARFATEKLITNMGRRLRIDDYDSLSRVARGTFPPSPV